MGNTVSQDTRIPPPTVSRGEVKPKDTHDGSTQTDDITDGNLHETSQLPEYTENTNDFILSTTSRPPDPPPYSSADDDSDNTGAKKDFSTENEKEIPNVVTLDDLKLTVEKQNVQFNEKLESIQKTLADNEERAQNSNQLLSQLQDTIMSSTQGPGLDRFTERLSKSVVHHLLKKEPFRDLPLQRDTQDGGNAASQSSADLAVTPDVNKKLEDDDESYLVDDNCYQCKCKKCKCTCHFSNIMEENEYMVTDTSVVKATNESKTFVTKISKRSVPGDDGPSSNSDESDDDDRYESARNHYPVRKKDNKTETDATESNMRIDTDAWANCFSQNDFEHEARKLLNAGILPDTYTLQQICVKYSRRSKVVQTICRSICRFLKQQSSQICDVWAAYGCKGLSLCEDTRIIFVLLTSKPVEIKTYFQIYQRCINDISVENEKENSEIKITESKHTLESTEMKGLTKSLKSNAKRLMEKHSKLTRVTLSWVKSRGFGSKDCSMQTAPCVALYVQIKGLVPINEEPFDEYVDGYLADVREGVFTFCGSPTDLHQNVKMGCALDSGFGTKQGTVGPFVGFQTDPHTYLLTSAHVLLDREQMKKLINDQCIYYGKCGTDTYQPPESVSVGQNTRHRLGRLELAVYRKGDENKSGMEIALVQIDENRLPIDGKFPDTFGANSSEFGEDNPFEFPFENVCDISTLSNSTFVYKYGSVTGLTKGKVRVEGASVRTNTLSDNNLGFEITLHEQIEIESVTYQPFGELGDSGSVPIPFGELGDSGSLVLQRNGDNLAAVGIFEGKSGDIYMITPIADVKQTLSETLSRYRQPPTEMGMVAVDKPSMILKLFYVPTNYDLTESNVNSREIEKEVAKRTAEMETNILHNSEHKINSVKAELTAIKQHIDYSNNVIKQNMDQMENRVIGNLSSQIGALTQLLVEGQRQGRMENNT